jgi:hypothetical protein
MAYYLRSPDGQVFRLDANNDGSLQTTEVSIGTGDTGDAVVGPSYTPQGIIKRALRLIGALATGENMKASEQEDGLEALNALFDSWNAEEILRYAVARKELTLLVQSPQSIGPAGELNTSRPLRIEQGHAYIKLADGSEQIVNVVSEQRFAEVNSDATGQPRFLYYDRTFPTGNIHLSPVPDQAYTLVLYSPLQLSQMADATTEFSLPPGYADALVHALAVVLGPEYGKKDQDLSIIAAQAAQKKQVIARANIKDVEMRCDSALLNCNTMSNIWTGR